MDILYQGLIETIPTDERDYILGSTSKLPKTVLQADRNWLPFKPTKEVQRNNLFDTYGCVSFSANNCDEIVEMRKYGTCFNASDKLLVVASGTIPGFGNSVDKVSLTKRKIGAVTEERYPFTKNMTQEEYYKPISQELFSEALKFNDVYEKTYEWVSWGGADKKKVFEALQYAPLQITIQAYGKYENGMFQPTGTQETNHAVTLMRWDSVESPMYILDHYDFEIKKLHPDYYIGACMRHNIEKRMLKLVKGDQKPEVYCIGADGKARHIYSEAVFNEGLTAGFWGDWDSINIYPQSAVSDLPKGHDIAFII